jgi:uncharacterized membrane protein YdbT with pleckstrin-like domain
MENQGEIIIWEGSQSQVLNLGVHVSMLVISAVIAVLAMLVFPPAIIAVFFPLMFMFYKWLKIKTNKYKITSERIFYTTGIFSKKTEAMELYRIKDIDIYEPFWQRIFKLGNIELSSSDETTPRFMLLAVPNPAKLQNEIRKNVELRRDVKRVRGVEFLGDESIENT